MSSLRKRGKYWFLDYRADGRRIRKALKTTDHAIARVRAQRFMQELDPTLSVRRRSFEEFTLEFFEYQRSRVSAGTLANYKSIIQKRFLPRMRAKYLDQIDQKTADEYIASLGQSMTPWGVRLHLRSLRTFFNVAVRWHYIGRNPFAEVKPPMAPSKRPRFLNRMEIDKIIKYARKSDPELADMVEIYVLTGLRRSELVDLEWDAVNFEADMLHIKHAKMRKERFVPIVPRVRSILHRRRHLPRPFPTYVGSTISHKFLALCRDLGIHDVSLHDLRRTFATRVASAGISMLDLKKLLGHSSLAVTDEYYHGFDTAEAREKIQDSIRPKKKKAS